MSESSVPTMLAPASLADACAASCGVAVERLAEAVSLDSAHGRVLFADLLSPTDFPRFDSSAMDGWALRSSDANGVDPVTVVGESRAGIPFTRELAPGEAVSIATGAELPAGADAVLPVEHGAQDGRKLLMHSAVAGGQFVRPAGRYARVGDKLLPAGARIGAGEIATLAAVGVDRAYVRARLAATVLGGGDELSQPGAPLRAGAIYDSNTPMLRSLLETAGCSSSVQRYHSDDAQTVTRMLADAVEASDLVVTVGGVSVGKHDHLPVALERLAAREVVNGTTARPGLKFRLSVAERADGVEVPIFCLPGNPLSAWFCFQLYVRRFVAASLGVPAPERFEAELAEPIPRASERTTLVLGRIEHRSATARFIPKPRASDATIALAGCNAYAVIERGEGVAHKGTRVECELSDG